MVTEQSRGYRKHGFLTKQRLHKSQIKLNYLHRRSLLPFVVVSTHLFLVE